MPSLTRTTRSSAPRRVPADTNSDPGGGGGPARFGGGAVSEGSGDSKGCGDFADSSPVMPQPDLAATTAVPSIARFEDPPCVAPGSLGAGNVCEPFRGFTDDGVAYDVSLRAVLVYRLTRLATTLPPVSAGGARFPRSAAPG